MSAIFEFLFGWILEILPQSMSAGARARAWRRGEKVILRARVRQDVRVDRVVLHGDRIWLVTNYGFEAETRREIRFQPPITTSRPGRPLRPDDEVTLKTTNGSFSIACPLDSYLLGEVAERWRAVAEG